MKRGIIAVLAILFLVAAVPFAWANVKDTNSSWGMMNGHMGMMSHMMDFDSAEFQEHVGQMREFHAANGINCPGIDQMTNESAEKTNKNI